MSREMPETFLELVQRSVWESHDVSGGPATVDDDSRAYRRHINWINWAWLDLQKQYPDWQFMFREFEAAWPSGSPSRTPEQLGLTGEAGSPPSLGHWKKGGDYRQRLTGAPSTEGPLAVQIYSEFKRQWLVGNGRTQTGKPEYLAVHPDKSLYLHPIPDKTYTIGLEYYRAPRPMIGNEAIPAGLPAEHRLVLVYRALTEYGGFNAANEVYQKAHHEGKRMMKQLEQVERPKDIRTGHGGPGRRWP